MAESFKIMSVNAVSGDIVFEVEHYNEIGNPKFWEEYDFQGRQGAVFEAETTDGGRPYLDNGELAPEVPDPDPRITTITNWRVPAGRTLKYTNVLLLKEVDILGIIARHHKTVQKKYDGRSQGMAQAEALAEIDVHNVQTLVEAFSSMAGKTYSVETLKEQA